MSLILDALKKSDRNRERGKVPDLQTDHSGDLPPKPPLRRHRRWLWPLLALVLIGGGWLAWQVIPDKAPAVSAPLVPSPIAIPAPPVAETLPAPSPAKPLEPAITAPPPKPGSSAAVAEDTSPSKPAPPAASSQPSISGAAEAVIYELDNLPPQIGSGLPELIVSVHYFTPNPESRMVRINNRILREGGSLPGGIKILSIERNGIICETQGVRFRLPTTSLATDRREEN